jgi:hypothetical protein
MFLRIFLKKYSAAGQSTVALGFVACFLVFIGLVYAKYVQQGGLVYGDDWLVWKLGSAPNLIDAYKRFFPAFAFRPLAPIYYALISRFEGFAAGYILVNVVLWCGSVVLTASVLRDLIETRFIVLFAFIAAIPLLSTTVIFSPAAQSIGSLAVFLWALSFMLLHQSIVRSSPKLALLSIVVCALMCATYEVALPLLALSLVWPLLRADRSIVEVVRNRIFLINISGILGVIILMIIYQKKLAPHLLAAIDVAATADWRLRLTDPADFLAIAYRNLNGFILIMARDTPKLLINGVLRLLADRSLATITAWLGGVLALLGSIFMVRRLPPVLKPSIHLLILLAAIVAGIFGVILIHTAAKTDPTIHGYDNRGLSSFSLLLPMLIAVASALAYRIGRWCGHAAIAMAVCFFAAYLASFLVQRDNYIAAVRVRSEMLADLAGKLDFSLKPDHANEPFLDITPSINVILNVPELDEIFFSDADQGNTPNWSVGLRRYSHGHLGGVTVSRKKLCGEHKQVAIKDDFISEADRPSVPIAGAWYYEYSPQERSSILLRIRDEGHLREVLRSRVPCSGP